MKKWDGCLFTFPEKRKKCGYCSEFFVNIDCPHHNDKI